MITRRALLASSSAGLFGVARNAQSAPDPFPDAIQSANVALYRDGRYLPLYRLAKTASAPGFRDYFEQSLAYVGDEAGALSRAGAELAPAPDLTDARADPALPTLLKAARERRVVMLNEAHTASRHRHFLIQLLRALRREGFTHLAAETFASGLEEGPAVEALRPGDSVGFGLGGYTADPVFAETVREALALGYRMVAYEQRPDQASPSREPAARIPVREQAQAENMAAHLRRWPNARFVVFVGYGHLDEREGVSAGPWFAARLKKLTGIDPLTIGQASSGSFGPHAKDNATMRAVLQRFRLREPSVVLKGGEPVALAHWPGDLTVYHPSLPDVRGRPGWLAADPRRRWRQARFAASGDVRLLQAVHSGDPAPAIPADQLVVGSGVRSAWMLLRPGRYGLRLETAAGFEPLSTAEVR